MLEPVAQYAQGWLVGDLARAATRAHAAVYVALAERAAAGYERDDQVLWLARTEADEANLMVAVDRTIEQGDPDTGGQIVWFLWLYWWLRGQPTIGRRRAEQCLQAPLAPAVLARAHLTAACMAYAGGDMAACADHWDTALTMGEAQQDAEVVCKALAGTGLATLAVGDLGAAGDRFRRSLPRCADAGPAGIWMSALVHIWLGTVVLLQGDPAGAVSEIERGLQIARSRGDRLSTYVALYNLAQVALAAGDHPQAQAHLEEGIVLSEQTSDLANLAYFLDALAVVESGAGGAAERVAVLIGAAQVLRATVGTAVYAYYVPDVALHAAVEQTARQQLGEQGFDAAVQRGRGLDLAGAVAFALHR
jgi:tetratricopeptide (TPR) repeat protein